MPFFSLKRCRFRGVPQCCRLGRLGSPTRSGVNKPTIFDESLFCVLRSVDSCRLIADRGSFFRYERVAGAEHGALIAINPRLHPSLLRSVACVYRGWGAATRTAVSFHRTGYGLTLGWLPSSSLDRTLRAAAGSNCHAVLRGLPQCDRSGLILKPSLPLAAIDRSFSAAATPAASRAPPAGSLREAHCPSLRSRCRSPKG